MDLLHLFDVFWVDSATPTDDACAQTSPFYRHLWNDFRVRLVFSLEPVSIYKIPFFASIWVYHDDALCFPFDNLDKVGNVSGCCAVYGDRLNLMFHVCFLNVSDTVLDGGATVES